MSRINIQQTIADYRQSNPKHATPEKFAERINECQGCECRVGSQCTQAKQLVTLMATTGIRCPKPKAVTLPPVESLAVVTCHFNPCGYRKPIENFFRFRAGLNPTGLPLYVAELAFDDDAFQLPSQFQFRVSRERGTMWQKERLINLAIKRLPEQFDAVAWIDADLLFLNPDWVGQALKALQSYRVVQLFGEVIDTDQRGAIVRDQIRPGIGRVVSEGSQQYGRPGGAWAARRADIPDGLYDRNIVGGGDSIMAHSWMGEVERSQSYAGFDRQYLREFCQRQHAAVDGMIGYVPGDLVHLFHGSRPNRQYVDRYQILRDGDYDPRTDLNETDGPLQWSDYAMEHKRPMVEAVRRYFVDRKEDSP